MLSEEFRILEQGIGVECADSINVAKPQIEALLKTDVSHYYTRGEGAFWLYRGGLFK